MKNKKILGALAALCMGVILCVSSVFAINYWYTITDNTNNSVVSTGNKIELTVANATGEAGNLMPGGVVQFETISVKAPKWNNDYEATYDGTDGDALNVLRPKFNLEVVTVSNETLAGQFTVYIKTSKDGDNTWKMVNFVDDGVEGAEEDVADTLAKDMHLVEDVQYYNDGADFTVQIRIHFANEAADAFANQNLTIKVGLVAYDGNGAKIESGTSGAGNVLDPTQENLFD